MGIQALVTWLFFPICKVWRPPELVENTVSKTARGLLWSCWWERGEIEGCRSGELVQITRDWLRFWPRLWERAENLISDFPLSSVRVRGYITAILAQRKALKNLPGWSSFNLNWFETGSNHLLEEVIPGHNWEMTNDSSKPAHNTCTTDSLAPPIALHCNFSVKAGFEQRLVCSNWLETQCHSIGPEASFVQSPQKATVLAYRISLCTEDYTQVDQSISSVEGYSKMSRSVIYTAKLTQLMARAPTMDGESAHLRERFSWTPWRWAMKVWLKAGDLLSNGFDPDEVSFFRTLVLHHPK